MSKQNAIDLVQEDICPVTTALVHIASESVAVNTSILSLTSDPRDQRASKFAIEWAGTVGFLAQRWNKFMVEHKDLLVQVRKDFYEKRHDDMILGCRTWEQYCANVLHYSVRHIRRLIEGDNPASEKHDGSAHRCPSGKKRYDSERAATEDNPDCSARIYTCSQCDGIHLDKRQTTEPPPPAIPAVCPDCDQSFESRSQLKKHAQSDHDIPVHHLSRFIDRADEIPDSDAFNEVFGDLCEPTPIQPAPASDPALFIIPTLTYYVLHHRASGYFATELGPTEEFREAGRFREPPSDKFLSKMFKTWSNVLAVSPKRKTPQGEAWRKEDFQLVQVAVNYTVTPIKGGQKIE